MLVDILVGIQAILIILEDGTVVEVEVLGRLVVAELLTLGTEAQPWMTVLLLLVGEVEATPDVLIRELEEPEAALLALMGLALGFLLLDWVEPRLQVVQAVLFMVLPAPLARGGQILHILIAHFTLLVAAEAGLEAVVLMRQVVAVALATLAESRMPAP